MGLQPNLPDHIDIRALAGMFVPLHPVPQATDYCIGRAKVQLQCDMCNLLSRVAWPWREHPNRCDHCPRISTA